MVDDQPPPGYKEPGEASRHIWLYFGPQEVFFVLAMKHLGLHLHHWHLKIWCYTPNE